MAATGSATWTGSINEGTGTVATGSGITGTFSKASRFADGGGTNPEELIGAAHAGCFSQFLALMLSEEGTPPVSIETTAKVSIAITDDGPTITGIVLTSVVDAPVSAEKIAELGDTAKAKCPVSKALAGVADVKLTISKA